MASSEEADMDKRSCGICSKYETGLNSMLPWGPDQLAVKSEEERGNMAKRDVPQLGKCR